VFDFHSCFFIMTWKCSSARKIRSGGCSFNKGITDNANIKVFGDNVVVRRV
jgi:hypothetical protein